MNARSHERQLMSCCFSLSSFSLFLFSHQSHVIRRSKHYFTEIAAASLLLSPLSFIYWHQDCEIADKVLRHTLRRLFHRCCIAILNRITVVVISAHISTQLRLLRVFKRVFVRVLAANFIAYYWALTRDLFVTSRLRCRLQPTVRIKLCLA